MSFIIRKGTAGDLDMIERLYGEVCDHMAATVNYCGWKRDVYPARQDAEAGIGEGALFLAEADGEAAGSFILRPKQEDAYTDDLEFAARYAAEQGAKALRLDVYEGNLPAIRLYESAGFRYAGTVSLGLEDIGLDWFRLYEKMLQRY